MLRRPTEEAVKKDMALAYKLTLDPSRSGYPVYTDGIKTRADFEGAVWKGFSEGNQELLLFEKNGMASGWIQFFFIPEEKYLQTVMFSISEDTQAALEEFTAYCAEKYPGYTLYLGFPGENRQALAWLEGHNWEQAEKCWNNVLRLENYEIQQEVGDIRPVSKENFADFRCLHSWYEADMYWNSERLYQALDQWDIWLYYENDSPVGAVYYQNGEIMGVDFREGIFRETVFHSLLVKVMNHCKKQGTGHIVFFHEGAGQATVLDAGFTCVGEYVLYIKTV